MHILYPTPLDSSLTMLPKPSKESGMAPLVLFLFTERQSKKGGHGTMADTFTALGYLITLIGRAKKGPHVFRCPVFTENIGAVKSKKRGMHVLRCSVLP